MSHIILSLVLLVPFLTAQTEDPLIRLEAKIAEGGGARGKALLELRQLLSTERVALRQLRQQFNDSWPAVQARRNRVSRIEKILEREGMTPPGDPASVLDRETGLDRVAAPAPQEAASARTSRREDPLQRLIRLMDRPDQGAKDVAQARRQLESLGALALPSVLRELEGLGPIGRLWALDFLARHDGTTARGVFTDALASSDPQRRLAAARSLTSLPPRLRLELGLKHLASDDLGVLLGSARAVLGTPGDHDRATAWKALDRVLAEGGEERRRRVLDLLREPALQDSGEARTRQRRLMQDVSPGLAAQAWRVEIERARRGSDEELASLLATAPVAVRREALERFAPQSSRLMTLALDDPDLRALYLESALHGATPVAARHRAWAVHNGSLSLASKALAGYSGIDEAMVEAIVQRLQRQEPRLAHALIEHLRRMAPRRLTEITPRLAPWISSTILPYLLDDFCEADTGEPLPLLDAVLSRREAYEPRTYTALARVLGRRLDEDDLRGILTRCRVPVSPVMTTSPVDETLPSVLIARLEGEALRRWLESAAELQAGYAVATLAAASHRARPEHDAALSRLIDAATRLTVEPPVVASEVHDRRLAGRKLLEGALMAIAKVGPGASFERLVAAITHDSSAVRKSARKCLRALAVDRFAPAAQLMIDLLNAPDRSAAALDLRHDLAAALGEMSPELRRLGLAALLAPPFEEDLVMDAIRHPEVISDDDLRQAAAAAIPHLSLIGESVPVFLTRLPQRERDALVRRLLRGPDQITESATGSTEKALRLGPPPELRITALQSLVGRTDIAAKELGRVLREDRDEGVRRAAARCLASHFTKEAARELVHGLRDPSSQVRNEARQGLETLKEFLSAQAEWK